MGPRVRLEHVFRPRRSNSFIAPSLVGGTNTKSSTSRRVFAAFAHEERTAFFSYYRIHAHDCQIQINTPPRLNAIYVQCKPRYRFRNELGMNRSARVFRLPASCNKSCLLHVPGKRVQVDAAIYFLPMVMLPLATYIYNPLSLVDRSVRCGTCKQSREDVENNNKTTFALGRYTQECACLHDQEEGCENRPTSGTLCKGHRDSSKQDQLQ